MFARLRCDEDGWVLPTVLIAIVILGLIAVGVTAQVRSELKAGALEPDVAQGQLLVWSELNRLARAAVNDASFGTTEADPTQAPPEGWTACNPVAVSPSEPNGPALCSDVLMRVTRGISIGNQTVNRHQVPIAVRWRLTSSDPVRTTYAWVVINPSNSTDVAVYYDHRWCKVKVPWDNRDFCEQGG